MELGDKEIERLCGIIGLVDRHPKEIISRLLHTNYAKAILFVGGKALQGRPRVREAILELPTGIETSGTNVEAFGGRPRVRLTAMLGSKISKNIGKSNDRAWLT